MVGGGLPDFKLEINFGILLEQKTVFELDMK